MLGLLNLFLFCLSVRCIHSLFISYRILFFCLETFILASVLKPIYAVSFLFVSLPSFRRRSWFKKPTSPAFLDQLWEQHRFRHDFAVFCAS